MAAVDDVRMILAGSDDMFTAGDKSAPCIFSNFDDAVQMDSFGGSKQLVRRTYALVCTDDFPDLAEDDSVTVNSVQYVVLDTRRVQDGHMMEVNLQTVAS